MMGTIDYTCWPPRCSCTVKPEPKVKWGKVTSIFGDLIYVTVVVAGKLVMIAWPSGSWQIKGITHGTAADLETAKACCIAYCKIYKLHMFAEPELSPLDSLQLLAVENHKIDQAIAVCCKKLRCTKKTGGISWATHKP